MSTARHQQIKDIFHRVVAVPVDERLAFLDRVCAGDAALRAEVLSLLAHDDVAGDAFADDRIGAMRAALVDVAQTPGEATDDAHRTVHPHRRPPCIASANTTWCACWAAAGWAWSTKPANKIPSAPSRSRSSAPG
jgi:hypothetical protein